MRDKDNLHGRNLVNLYDVIQIPKQYVMGSEDKESIIIDIKDYT